jgi:hypothetical protein
MCRLAFLLIAAMLLAACGANSNADLPQTGEPLDISGDELLARTIAYHDPTGVWDSFSGTVRLITARADGSSSGFEFIHVDNPSNLYRAVRIVGDVRIEFGESEGNCFHSLNGETELTPDEIERYNLVCENTLFRSEHHTAHIGLPMEIRESGMQIDEDVTRTELGGEPALSWTMVGDSTTVRHPYWASRVTLFVNPDTYAMLGYQVEPPEGSGMLWLLSGELDINGIKMPQVKRVYDPEDGSLIFTDVFTHVTEWELGQL